MTSTTIPITYVPARNTIFLSFALAWAEVLGAATSSSASTRSTTAATPTAGPSTSTPSSTMANLATKAGVEGDSRLTIHTPLIDLTQGRDHRARASTSASTTRSRVSCYDPDDDGRACGAVRLLPAAAQGLRRGGRRRPASTYQERRRCMTYLVKEIFYTLQGEGAHAAGRRCSAASPAATSGPAARSDRAPRVCQFCDTDFVGTDGPGGGTFADRRRRSPTPSQPRWAGVTDGSRPFVVCTGGEPLLQLDDAARRRAPRRGLRGRRRDQRHAARARRASTGSASARRPAPTSS